MKNLSGKKIIFITVALVFLCLCTACIVFLGIIFFSDGAGASLARQTTEKFFANAGSSSAILDLSVGSAPFLNDEYSFNTYAYPYTGEASIRSSDSDAEKLRKLDIFIDSNCLKTATNVKISQVTKEIYAEFGTINKVYGSYTCSQGTKYFLLEILSRSISTINISSKPITVTGEPIK